MTNKLEEIQKETKDRISELYQMERKSKGRITLECQTSIFGP